MAVKKFQDQLRLKKRRKKLVKLGLVAGVVFLILAGAGYFLFFAGVFDVRSVKIEGSQTILQSEVESMANSWLNQDFLGIKRRSNSWILSARELSLFLASQLPKVESLAVVKLTSHEVGISVTERKPEGIWCLVKTDRCFFFDGAGIAYEEAGLSEGFILTSVADGRLREIQLGSPVAPEEWFRSIATARDLLQKGGLEIKGVIIPENSFDEFSILVVPNWRVLLNIATDIPKQINSMFNVLKNKITSSQRVGLEYIDLRIQDRIYYK